MPRAQRTVSVPDDAEFFLWSCPALPIGQTGTVTIQTPRGPVSATIDADGTDTKGFPFTQHTLSTGDGRIGGTSGRQLVITVTTIGAVLDAVEFRRANGTVTIGI